MFGRGVVSRRHQELNAAFSPAGDELFFTLADPSRTHYTLLRMVRGADGVWKGPEVAPFSGVHADADPVFSEDGQRVYFISKRPRDAAQAANDFDIWSVEKTQAGWGEPVNLGAPINTPDDEFYVSVTRTGSILLEPQGRHLPRRPRRRQLQGRAAGGGGQRQDRQRQDGRVRPVRGAGRELPDIRVVRTARLARLGGPVRELSRGRQVAAGALARAVRQQQGVRVLSDRVARRAPLLLHQLPQAGGGYAGAGQPPSSSWSPRSMRSRTGWATSTG